MKLLTTLAIGILPISNVEGVFAQTSDALATDKVVARAASKIMAAAQAEANARGLGVVIVVIDDAGNIIQLSRMDSAQVASVNVGTGKAAGTTCQRDRGSIT